MPNDHDLDDPLAAQAIRLGREGRGRREIASALGMSLAELEALEEARGGFAAAMQRAEDEARAWWDRLGREALWEGGKFSMAAWRAEVGSKFDWGPPPPPPPLTWAQMEAMELATFDIPDNGMERGPYAAPRAPRGKKRRG